MSEPPILDRNNKPITLGAKVDGGDAANGEVTKIERGVGHPFVSVAWPDRVSPEPFKAVPRTTHRRVYWQCEELEILDA